MKRPAFQFYPADWRKDAELQSCSMTARGLWHEAMCVMHECEPYGELRVNGKPMKIPQLARVIGMTSAECGRAWAELEAAGVPGVTADGAYYSRRMVKDERVRNARAEGGKAGAEHGDKGASHGAKGGRPRVDTGVIKPPLYPPPSSSTSSSSSSSVQEDTSLRSDKQRAVNPPRARKVRSEIEPEGFAEFYQAYPLHKARPAAAKAYGNALKRAPAAALLDGARRYAAARANEDPNFTKHPATWLNNDCWMDQEVSHETPIVRGRVRPASGQLTFVEAGASLIRELFADGGQAEGGNDNPAALEISRPLLSG